MEEKKQGNTAKIIQLDEYNRSLGTDELNLAEFPLAALATRTEPGQNTLLFEDSIFDEGAKAQVCRTLVIAGSDHFGLPTATDSDILLMLIHLSNVRNGFQSKRVEFSRYELIKFLGWPQDGRSYKRLDESLQRWTSVTLHYKHAWWSRHSEKWRSRSFHVIETLELRARDEIHDDGLSSFTWNDVIFESFNAGNLRRIDLEVYFSLKRAAAKQMFRFLGKRFYKRAVLQFDLREFAIEHIGLGRKYDVFGLKRKLTPAIEELVEIGFLEAMPPEDRFRKLSAGNWEVTFIKGEGAKAAKPEEDSLVTRELVCRGVTAKSARELGLNFSTEHINEKIAWHDELVAAKDKRVSRNAAGFLVSAIRDDFRPALSQRGSRSAAIPLVKSTSLKPVTEDSAPCEHAFAVFWNGLPIDEQARLEREALEAAPTFHKLTISRLESNKSELRAQMKLKLIREYVTTGKGHIGPSSLKSAK